MRNPCTKIVVLSAAAFGACAEPMQTFGGVLAIIDDASGLNIDVNADGVFDLRFAYFGVSVNSVFGWDGVVNQADDEAGVRFAGGLDSNGRSVHTRFEPDAEIGPAIDTGFPFGAIAYEGFFDGTSGGAWLDMEPGFLGFSFLSTTGERHYGWAEVEIDNADDPGFGSLILTRIAYETVAGVPIAAGDTGADPGCNPADLAEPYGTLDLADISAFVAAFVANDPIADLNTDELFDLTDLSAFVQAFTAGCP